MKVIAVMLPLIVGIGSAFGVVPRTSTHILAKLHLLNQGEVDAGRLGQNYACRQDVKQYARHLFTDHSASDQKLIQIASRSRIYYQMAALNAWEKQNVLRFQTSMQSLRRTRGCQFDREYLNAMKDAHDFAIQLVNPKIQAEKNMQVRLYLVETLKALRMHRDQAISLLRK